MEFGSICHLYSLPEFMNLKLCGKTILVVNTKFGLFWAIHSASEYTKKDTTGLRIIDPSRWAVATVHRCSGTSFPVNRFAKGGGGVLSKQWSCWVVFKAKQEQQAFGFLFSICSRKVLLRHRGETGIDPWWTSVVFFGLTLSAFWFDSHHLRSRKAVAEAAAAELSLLCGVLPEGPQFPRLRGFPGHGSMTLWFCVSGDLRGSLTW